jgi:hypothetical protein
MSKNYYNTLKAGSEVVTMRQMNPYIYENVIKMSENIGEEQSIEAITLYQKVFIDRFTKLVIDYSNNSN